MLFGYGHHKITTEGILDFYNVHKESDRNVVRNCINNYSDGCILINIILRIVNAFKSRRNTSDRQMAERILNPQVFKVLKSAVKNLSDQPTDENEISQKANEVTEALLNGCISYQSRLNGLPRCFYSLEEVVYVMNKDLELPITQITEKLQSASGPGSRVAKLQGVQKELKATLEILKECCSKPENPSDKIKEGFFKLMSPINDSESFLKSFVSTPEYFWEHREQLIKGFDSYLWAVDMFAKNDKAADPINANALIFSCLKNQRYKKAMNFFLGESFPNRFGTVKRKQLQVSKNF